MRHQPFNDDRTFLAHAVQQARISWEEGGIPSGAILAHDGEVLALGRNRLLQSGSVIRHSVLDCLEDAGPLPAEVYRASTLYVTRSLCPMCAAAVVHCEISRVVVGARLARGTTERAMRSRGIAVETVADADCAALRTLMTAERRGTPAERILAAV